MINKSFNKKCFTITKHIIKILRIRCTQWCVHGLEILGVKLK